MKSIFSPATALMNRLGYNKKFTLLALVSTVAFAVVVYGLYVSLDREIKTAQRELDGLALIGPVFQVMQLVQRHRALDTTLIKGVVTMRSEHDAIEKAVDGALDATEAKLRGELKAISAWQEIKKSWMQLRGDGLNWTAGENFAAQTRLIEQILSVQSMISDEHGLILDSDASSYYLIDIIINDLPHVIEHLGQLRAQGVGNLIDRKITEPQRIRAGAVANELGDALKNLDANLEKAARHNPVLQSSLLTVSREIAGSVEQITGLVESDILSGRFTLTPEKYYAMASVAIDDSYRQLHESLLSATESLLKARITKVQNTLYAALGITCLLLLIVTYFTIGIYYSIVGSARALARSAQFFADGDLRERVNLGTHDELGQIGSSFNKMADSFNALLAARRQAEDFLQISFLEQKEINQKLDDAQRHESEALDELRLMLNTSGEGFWKVDLSGIITETNEAYCRLVGYARDGIIGAHIAKFEALEPTQEVVAAHIQHIVELGHDRFETKHRHHDGHLIDIEVAASSIPDKKCLIVFLRDVTGRKLMGEELRKSETKFRALYESSSDGIMLLDRNGFFDCNEAALRIFGCPTRDDFLNKHPSQFSPDVQPGGQSSMSLSNEHIATAFKHGNDRFEWMHCRFDGSEFPAEVLLTSFDLNGVRVLQATVRDISARKKAEDNLRNSNEKLEAINHRLQDTQNQLLQSEKMASIGQLAAGVAHEINNPIGYVYSNLGTLEKYVQDTFGLIEQYEQAEGAIADAMMQAQLKAAREKLDIEFLKEDLRALMNESKDGITRVKQIVQNLKDFSHVDASDEWHFSDLHRGIESTLNIVNNEIKYKAEVVREYGDIPEIECLLSQLNQVFMNLLVNASHAIEERGVITIRTGQQGEEVWVEIADTGKGIAPEHIKKIFDPFFTTKPIGKGTGLGLSLSYGIVQKHHGRIEVQSEIGKGTAFRVWLPMKQTEEAQQL